MLGVTGKHSVCLHAHQARTRPIRGDLVTCGDPTAQNLSRTKDAPGFGRNHRHGPTHCRRPDGAPVERHRYAATRIGLACPRHPARLETLQLLKHGSRVTADLPVHGYELRMLKEIGMLTSRRIERQRLLWMLEPEALVRISCCLAAFAS